MKTGITFFIATSIWWTIFTKVDSFWVYQHEIGMYLSTLLILTGFAWLIDKKNRQTLKDNYRACKEMSNGGNVLKMFANGFVLVLFIGSFGVFATLAEGTRLYVKNSEAYEFVKAKVKENDEVINEIGTCQDLVLTNSYSLSANDEHSIWRLKLIAYGSSKLTFVDVTAEKIDKTWRISDLTVGN